MKINLLEISNFRNFESVSLRPGPKINLFTGLNGSGKTSLLEAIHYLGLGRSFRTRNLARIIHHQVDGFNLFSQLTDPSGLLLPVGIERKKDSTYTIKIGGQPAGSLVELANLLPLQLINADSHLLLSSGPLIRRQFLDWGVFHVEPSFYYYWQRASRIIKQRNASLKTASSYKDLTVWDEELQKCATWLDMTRRKYIEEFSPVFEHLITNLLPSIKFNLHYYSGWSSQKEIKEVLASSFERDRQFGYTHQGPHRADLQLKINTVPALDILSQGQQKLAAYSLRLAQGILLERQTQKYCIYLIDDLPSELDNAKQKLLADILLSLDAQVFVTSIEPAHLASLLQARESKMFHVEHGKIVPYG